MEILRNSVPTVFFYFPTPDTSVSSCTWSLNGVVQGALPFTTNGVDTATARLPYMTTEGSVLVTWTFSIPGVGTGITEVQELNVITPYLSLREVKNIAPDLSDEKAQELEATVRYTINAHCGQTFGYSQKTLRVKGSGTRSVQLPERLVSMDSISSGGYDFNINAYSITGDGWYLNLYENSLETVKQMPSEQSLDMGPVITTPFTAWYAGFHPNRWFDVTGMWGWPSVPGPVKQAAKLLADDYSCNEVAYRDKYLESITSADWRLQFSSDAYEYTGNARADQLLRNYVVTNWMVL